MNLTILVQILITLNIYSNFFVLLLKKNWIKKAISLRILLHRFTINFLPRFRVRKFEEQQ